MAETCSTRLIGTWPIGRDAMRQMTEMDPTGMPDWFLDYLKWMQGYMSDILDNALLFSDMHGNEGDAFRIPVSRTCPPDAGDLSAASDWMDADFDLMQFHVCYCNDEYLDEHIRLLGMVLQTEITPDPGNPGEFLYLPHLYAARVPIMPWSDEDECCIVPVQTYSYSPPLPDGWAGTGTQIFVIYAVVPAPNTSHAEWTGAADVWGAAPTLNANLNNLGYTVTQLWNCVAQLQAALYRYQHSMAHCWDLNVHPILGYAG